jgi:hypothetical protein
MIFGEEYKADSSLLCSLLQFRVTSSLLGSNIFSTRKMYVEHVDLICREEAEFLVLNLEVRVVMYAL